ncbi:hypothetical protein NHX12_034252 [Muraenolepis orangiensis]|uniref:RING-type E3 ubiquitin transferase n=1 Tax=Muraenolepis orangiensis TaxID=630683 RepID=A0A9Q0D5P9_9TELE|nr:hypothetical protein NHX12_034252 [Muraenolepis orangiensis]
MDVDGEPEVVSVRPSYPDRGRRLHSILPYFDSSVENGPDQEEPAPVLSTWAFNQRGSGPVQRVERGPGAVRGASTTQRPRRVRRGLRVHYPSQNTPPSRDFLDFLLRVPAPTRPGSSTEVSGSDTEEDAEPSRALAGTSLDPHAAGATAALGPTARTTGSTSLTSEPAGGPVQVRERTNPPAGEHRLATLRCGHLFGHACIERWLKGQGQAARCPQCNKKAKRSDIVLLYARKLRPLDTSEQEGMKKSLAVEQSLRRKAELESAQCRLQLQVVTEECGKLRRQLQELRTMISQAGASSSSTGGRSLSQRAEVPGGGHYVFSKAVLVSQSGGCRVLAFCPPLSCLLASQPSPQATLVPGYGVKKVSTVNMKASQYVPIHSKHIRGLAFNTTDDSLMLSASLDNTLKLTSNYVYAGLVNGSVLLYDTRDTSTHVQELLPLGSRSPVASLCYVPRAGSSSFPCGGVVAGSLEGGCFWEQVESSIYRPHQLPLEGAGCIDIQVEPHSRHCLVTYRPGRSNPSLRCVLMEMTRQPQLDSFQTPSCSCSPVLTFSAGSSCTLLTKNAVFPRPAGGPMLVCAGDEASNSTMVWDAGSGSLLQKLPADLPVLDICPLEVSGEHYLASLTEKMLKIYKWE